mmetsp:Transcript_39814/g.86137  ORF Transcript_39814/g.86137 Transcript_39814/m.86137 type:complete len:304 (-) Transcript_39814:266-1177(-)
MSRTPLHRLHVGILHPHPVGWILRHRNSSGTSLLFGGPLWHRFGRDAKYDCLSHRPLLSVLSGKRCQCLCAEGHWRRHFDPHGSADWISSCGHGRSFDHQSEPDRGLPPFFWHATFVPAGAAHFGQDRHLGDGGCQPMRRQCLRGRMSQSSGEHPGPGPGLLPAALGLGAMVCHRPGLQPHVDHFPAGLVTTYPAQSHRYGGDVLARIFGNRADRYTIRGKFSGTAFDYWQMVHATSTGDCAGLDGGHPSDLHPLHPQLRQGTHALAPPFGSPESEYHPGLRVDVLQWRYLCYAPLTESAVTL